MLRIPVLSATAAACVLLLSHAGAQPFNDEASIDNPAVAKYQGGVITLRNLEDYGSEINKLDRCPRLVDGKLWRDHMSRELCKNILFTSHALQLGQHLDPAFLRARNYYIQEWCSYAILRDNVVNKIDVSLTTLRDYYELHKSDWYVSATVSLRVIRTRDPEKAKLAMERLKRGESFVEVEKNITEMSLKMRGQVYGPFPTTDTVVTLIPPPEEVIEAARQTEVGQTTGPLFLNNNYFIAQTETRTPAKQLTFEEALPFVETQVRNLQGDLLIKKLLAQLYDELKIRRDDAAISNPSTKVEDIIATVGETLVPYDEYFSLNGRVRGPALHASTLESTPLARFLVPTIFAEAAKRRGYVEDAEFKKALLFHDLRRIGRRMLDRMVDEMTPRVTEAEIRRYYNINKNSKDEHGHLLGSMSLEEVRGGITELLNQQKRGETERRIQEQILTEGQYEQIDSPESTLLTAMEALVAASGKIPAGYKVRMITTVPEGETTEPIRMVNCGRRKTWKIVCTNDSKPGETLEIAPPLPARIFDASEHFTSNTLYMPWAKLWRFDTDGLARLAYDGGLSDYMAKHNRNVHVNTRVEFDWDGNKPKECWVVLEMRPLEPGTEDDVLTMRFSAETGSVSRKPLHECVPCEQMKRLMNEPI